MHITYEERMNKNLNQFNSMEENKCAGEMMPLKMWFAFVVVFLLLMLLRLLLL